MSYCGHCRVGLLKIIAVVNTGFVAAKNRNVATGIIPCGARLYFSCQYFQVKMAAAPGRSEPKLALEIRTKSVEQTLVPLVTQVSLVDNHIFFQWRKFEGNRDVYSSNSDNQQKGGWRDSASLSANIMIPCAAESAAFSSLTAR